MSLEEHQTPIKENKKKGKGSFVSWIILFSSVCRDTQSLFVYELKEDFPVYVIHIDLMAFAVMVTSACTNDSAHLPNNSWTWDSPKRTVFSLLLSCVIVALFRDTECSLQWCRALCLLCLL